MKCQNKKFTPTLTIIIPSRTQEFSLAVLTDNQLRTHTHAHTQSPDFGFHYLFFSKTTYHVAYLPKTLWVNQLFLSFHVKIFRFETTFANKECCKKRRKNKQQAMFNRRCVSTNCYHFLQCLKLTQKWQWVSKITCTPKEEEVWGGFWKVLKVQQTCSWVYLIFRRAHLAWHVGLPLTLRKGRFNSQWCLRFVKFLTADSWKSVFSQISLKKSLQRRQRL